MTTMGWECPRCHQCHAPWVKVCKCVPTGHDPAPPLRYHRWVGGGLRPYKCSDCGLESTGLPMSNECPGPTPRPMGFPFPGCNCDGCKNERHKAGRIEYRDTP